MCGCSWHLKSIKSIENCVGFCQHVLSGYSHPTPPAGWGYSSKDVNYHPMLHTFFSEVSIWWFTNKLVGQIWTLQQFSIQRSSMKRGSTVQHHTQFLLAWVVDPMMWYIPHFATFSYQLLLWYNLSISFCQNILHQCLVFLQECLVWFEAFQQLLCSLQCHMPVVGHGHIWLTKSQLELVVSIFKHCWVPHVHELLVLHWHFFLLVMLFSKVLVVLLG